MLNTNLKNIGIAEREARFTRITPDYSGRIIVGAFSAASPSTTRPSTSQRTDFGAALPPSSVTPLSSAKMTAKKRVKSAGGNG
jgi:hypothetical protein